MANYEGDQLPQDGDDTVIPYSDFQAAEERNKNIHDQQVAEENEKIAIYNDESLRFMVEFSLAIHAIELDISKGKELDSLRPKNNITNDKFFDQVVFARMASRDILRLRGVEDPYKHSYDGTGKNEEAKTQYTGAITDYTQYDLSKVEAKVEDKVCIVALADMRSKLLNLFNNLFPREVYELLFIPTIAQGNPFDDASKEYFEAVERTTKNLPQVEFYRHQLLDALTKARQLMGIRYGELIQNIF